MLFADHCGHGEWRTGEGDLVVGNTVAIDSNNDSQLGSATRSARRARFPEPYVTEQAVFVDGYGWVFGVSAGHEEHGNAAAGNGDSGGPVVVLNGDLSSVARGTISAILDDFVPCPGVPTGNGRECSADVYVHGTPTRVFLPPVRCWLAGPEPVRLGV
jgi:hypothetical protein